MHDKNEIKKILSFCKNIEIWKPEKTNSKFYIIFLLLCKIVKH